MPTRVRLRNSHSSTPIAMPSGKQRDPVFRIRRDQRDVAQRPASQSGALVWCTVRRPSQSRRSAITIDEADRHHRLAQVLSLHETEDRDLHHQPPAQRPGNPLASAEHEITGPSRRRRTRDSRPSRYSDPCARFTLRISPNTSVKPLATMKYSDASVRPFQQRDEKSLVLSQMPPDDETTQGTTITTLQNHFQNSAHAVRRDFSTSGSRVLLRTDRPS
jgi:hypothetical protein